MRLIRFDGDKTGLVVELPSGPHVVDVVASIGALVPEDPISHGILNGLLKDNGNWAPLTQHWKIAYACLRRLALRRAPHQLSPGARYRLWLGGMPRSIVKNQNQVGSFRLIDLKRTADWIDPARVR
jgi:hypothetical protein